MTGEPGSAAPSNVTVCSTGSRLVQRTACPAEMVMASPANFTAVMLTSAATAAPDAPSATGLGERWIHGAKRLRWIGMVNSKPYSTFERTSGGATPSEAPWIVALVALLAWSENVCPTVRAAWSAAIVFLIPGSPHTFSPWIVALVALLAWSENVCGDPGIKKVIAALQAARTVGLTNEPMSALAPTYGFRRALNPPANAAAPFRNWPRRRETPRAAPCSVRAPRVQSTPSSPSTLFARKLYAGVTAMAKPGWPSVPCTRQRPYTSVSLVDCAPLARPTIDLVANRAPR